MADIKTAEMVNKRVRLFYIDGLKGIACVMVMLSHYFAILKDAEGISQFPLLSGLYGSVCRTVIDENFWLQLFFVVSGFLVSQSAVADIRGLLKRSIRRFLRFYLPILAACILIFILAKTVGFHNKELTGVFAGQWFGIFYGQKIGLADLVTDPIKTVLSTGSKFNAPYWVISDMFYSSLLIYVISYVTGKAGARRIWAAGIYIIAIAAAAVFLGPIYTGCLAGGLCGTMLREFRGSIGKITQTVSGILCVVCIALPFGLHEAVCRAVFGTPAADGTTSWAAQMLGFRNDTWGVLYLALLIIFMSNSTGLQKALSGGWLRWLNDISFGVYSFHWPLLCSVGALVMISIHSKQGVLAAWGTCVVLTLIVSVFYHIVFEKNINRIMKKI